MATTSWNEARAVNGDRCKDVKKALCVLTVQWTRLVNMQQSPGKNLASVGRSA